MLPEQEAFDIAQSMSVSRETFVRLRLFEQELHRWQRRINLIGRRSPKAFWTHDVADAVALSHHTSEGVLLDWGSGAGLPGLLWALLPDTGSLHSVEANGKKVAFQRHVSRELGLGERVTIRNTRIENSDADKPSGTLTARALTELDGLCELWSSYEPACKRALFFKGRSYEKELNEAALTFRFDSVVHDHPFTSGSVLLEISNLRRR